MQGNQLAKRRRGKQPNKSNSDANVQQLVERILTKRAERKWLSFSISVAVSSLASV